MNTMVIDKNKRRNRADVLIGEALAEATTVLTAVVLISITLITRSQSRHDTIIEGEL